jgi:hypothetical protein
MLADQAQTDGKSPYDSLDQAILTPMWGMQPPPWPYATSPSNAVIEFRVSSFTQGPFSWSNAIVSCACGGWFQWSGTRRIFSFCFCFVLSCPPCNSLSFDLHWSKLEVVVVVVVLRSRTMNCILPEVVKIQSDRKHHQREDSESPDNACSENSSAPRPFRSQFAKLPCSCRVSCMLSLHYIRLVPSVQAVLT